MVTAMEQPTPIRAGRKPGAKTYPAAFVAERSDLREHFKALDEALATFKKATAADRRLERSIAGKSPNELRSLVTEAEKRVRLLKEALRAST